MLYRDLGGIKNKDGRTIKENYLIRSANLSKINGKLMRQLEKCHLRKVIDLRTSEEASEKPNKTNAKAQYIHIPILNEKTVEITREKDIDIAKMLQTLPDMANLYRSTSPGTFHAPNEDVENAFMRQQLRQTYFWGDKFAAVDQSFVRDERMWFVLPDEGIAPEELLMETEVMEFLFTADRNEWEKQKYLLVNKSIPKFDVFSQFDLKEGLQALGITAIFDSAVSDFTPMTTDVEDPIILSQADHAVRVTIDEEGCTAAAFTVLATAGAGAPNDDEEVDFVLDRPFIFCVTGINGLPLFVGIVNNPAG